MEILDGTLELPRWGIKGDPMEPIDVAREYLDAWNRHDSAAIVATFADGGPTAIQSSPRD